MKLNELRSKVRGTVVSPQESEYEVERRLYNSMIDKRPSLIVKCLGLQDVQHALEYAETLGLKVSVRGGGHGVSGSALVEGGLVIDLSRMNGVWVDPKEKTAIVQGGVVWGEFDREAQVFGLANPGGKVSTTGVAGFTLGSGIGWLSNKYGLACDNLLGAQVVTVDGRVLNVDEDNERELFWAIRGGGHSMAVVTSFKFRLHRVGPMVCGGLLIYPERYFQ
ncbi:hypothetical protein HS1genome_1584 [Sulfodiicoccus acidiphilus]|uniref:FAD-binding PCMH-type domain-containing protein n=1 Tax=Sulfodiicoccus acidiphilus TaxID=1670455 RepID=A0A348B4U3_9CREN|nr:FAD-dependent oxidoreductase [Sulfodiicoccus acidiphilus]BBD73195.1 hypothetical protein HS1genome_1584 [Sulfodiicoccus acidiphilus]GGU01425.1 hypothetical protein GCM10007116_18290 [Sulfodiicoccus acidiphilus]